MGARREIGGQAFDRFDDVFIEEKPDTGDQGQDREPDHQAAEDLTVKELGISGAVVTRDNPPAVMAGPPQAKSQKKRDQKTEAEMIEHQAASQAVARIASSWGGADSSGIGQRALGIETGAVRDGRAAGAGAIVQTLICWIAAQRPKK